MEHVLNGLYIGEIQDISPLSDTPYEPDRFDHVITLGYKGTPYTTERYEVVTNPAPWRPFFEAVEVTRQVLRADAVDAFLHCQVGLNRVAAVSATAIAAEEGLSFAAGHEHIREARDTDIHEELEDLGGRYLELVEAFEEEDWEMDGELELDPDNPEGSEG